MSKIAKSIEQAISEITPLLPTMQRAVCRGDGSVLPINNATLGYWFEDVDLPQIAPLGSTDVTREGEDVASIVRDCCRTDDTEEAYDLVDDDGDWCGCLRYDSCGWMFLSPSIMSESDTLEQITDNGECLAERVSSFGQYDNPSVSIYEYHDKLYLIEYSSDGHNVINLDDAFVPPRKDDEDDDDYAERIIEDCAANMIPDDLSGGYLIAERYAWGVGLSDEIDGDESDDTMVAIIAETEYYSHTEYSCVDADWLRDIDQDEWADQIDRDGEMPLSLAREIVEWLDDDQVSEYGCAVLEHNQAAATKYMICKY